MIPQPVVKVLRGEYVNGMKRVLEFVDGMKRVFVLQT